MSSKSLFNTTIHLWILKRMTTSNRTLNPNQQRKKTRTDPGSTLHPNNNKRTSNGTCPLSSLVRELQQPNWPRRPLTTVKRCLKSQILRSREVDSSRQTTLFTKFKQNPSVGKWAAKIKIFTHSEKYWNCNSLTSLYRHSQSKHTKWLRKPWRNAKSNFNDSCRLFLVRRSSSLQWCW